MPSVIETHPKKAELIEALLAGMSLRKVAAMAGVSHTQVAEYKNKVLLPSLDRAAKIGKLEQLVQAAETNGLDTERLEGLTKAVAAVSETKPGSAMAARWFERQEDLYQSARDLYSNSLKAQRIYTTEKGEQVFNGQDFAAPVGVLNQLHRNQELAGRAAGVLAEGGAGSVNIQNMMVVLPRAEAPRAELAAAIDVKAESTEG
jgi:transcriptional regulator with XRE-family HTH domain